MNKLERMRKLSVGETFIISGVGLVLLIVGVVNAALLMLHTVYTDEDVPLHYWFSFPLLILGFLCSEICIRYGFKEAKKEGDLRE